MPIKLTCPNCQRTLMVPRGDAGKPAMCNACGQRLEIPTLPLAPGLMMQLSDTVQMPALADTPDYSPPPTPAPVVPPALPVSPTATPIEPATLRATPASTVDSGSSRFKFAAATMAILLVVGGIWRFVFHRGPDAWEMENRAAILKMVDDADGAVIAGNLAVAALKYREVEELASGHPVVDESLRFALDRAAKQKTEVLAALVKRSAAPRASVVSRSVPLPAVTSASAEAPAPIDPPREAVAAVPAASQPVIPPASQPSVLRIPLQIARQTPELDPLNDQRIGIAIEKGANWMIARFDPAAHQLAGDPDRAQYRGGLNALCIYALLQAGESIHDDRLDIRKDFMKGLLNKLDALPMGERQTYGRGLRASALALHNRKEDRLALTMDVGWLLKSHRGGAYSYNEMHSPDEWDNSNSQYGLLGVWSGAEADIEVSGAYWRSVQKHWEKDQTESGGWGYRSSGTNLSMTLAGVASLFVCHDYLEGVAAAGNVGRPPFSPALAKGLDWLEQGDHLMDNGMMWGYTLYGVERVGLASGFKFFGQHDWFRERALQALDMQQPNGSWADDEKETAYALLFLARGRHPILMNKLRFDGYWANRPRDVANLARFAGKELERPLNFQVVGIDRDWTDWTESRVLYLASHQAPKLTDAQAGNLRKFVEAGGLLYTQADGGAPAFDAFAQELAKKLFPQYPMIDVPKDHPVYSMLYKINPAPPLKMVSNGVRALMIHSPQDLSIAWQQRMEKSRPAAFQMGVNLFLYASGKTDLKNRVASNVIPEPKPATGGTIKVARLKYAGAWDPEPAAWPRFARWFQQETSCGIDVTPVDLAALQPKVMLVAHLTGSAEFTPTPEQAAAVRAYVDAGGTLLIDAAGGSVPFSESVVQLLAKAFPDASLKKLPANHPLLAAAFPGMEALPDPPSLRLYALTTLGKGAGGLEELPHGNGRVIFIAVDLTSALLATQTWGIPGYTPEYAQALLKNVILWTAGGAPDKLK